LLPEGIPDLLIFPRPFALGAMLGGRVGCAPSLESFLLRRAVCGHTTKNYNRIFLTMTKNLRRDGLKPESLVAQLNGQTGESGAWPSDEDFREAWHSRHAYQTLNNPTIVHILRRLNDTYIGGKMESLSIDSPLTVEHIMPQQWIQHWPLSNGLKGMTTEEMFSADSSDPRTVATKTRNAAVQTMGNLTVLAQALNSSVSNAPWANKKPEILSHSLLPLNQQLVEIETWDEAAISRRSSALFERALKLWPRS
jgi:hypothetical protein